MARVTCRRADPLPAGAGARAGREAACSAACNVRSPLRELRGARCRAAGPASQDGVMSLPASQRRALNQIERTLADDHPTLGPLFAIFTRLTGREAMPVTERVTARPWRWQRWIRPRLVTIVGLAMAMGVLVAISVMLPGPQECATGTVTSAAAHTPSVPTGRQAACAPHQNIPSKTSQSGLYAP